MKGRIPNRWMPMFLVLMAGFTPVAPAQVPGRVEAARGGAALPAESVRGLEPLLVRLLESCSVESTGYVDQGAAWQNISRSGAYVRVRWVQPRAIRLHDGRVMLADEAIFELGAGHTPDHLHVKSGRELRSFTKYRPEVLLAIALEPALQLADDRPFAQWATVGWLADQARAVREAGPGH